MKRRAGGCAASLNNQKTQASIRVEAAYMRVTPPDPLPTRECVTRPWRAVRPLGFCAGQGRLTVDPKVYDKRQPRIGIRDPTLCVHGLNRGNQGSKGSSEATRINLEPPVQAPIGRTDKRANGGYASKQPSGPSCMTQSVKPQQGSVARRQREPQRTLQ